MISYKVQCLTIGGMDLDGDPDWDLDGTKHGKVIDNRRIVINGDKNFNIDTTLALAG